MSLRVIPLLLLAACGAPPRTEMVVVVNTPSQAVLAHVDTVRIRVRDVTAPQELYASPADPLCTDGAAPCLTMPIVLTLVPGPERPRDLVEVQVTAQRGAQVLIDQVTRFTFAEGKRQRLDFKLHEACLGVTSCTDTPLVGACSETGACLGLVPTTLTADPLLDGGVPRGAGPPT